MTNHRHRRQPQPAPRPAPRPAHQHPGITAEWLGELLAGRISVPPGEYTVGAVTGSSPERARASTEVSTSTRIPTEPGTPRPPERACQRPGCGHPLRAHVPERRPGYRACCYASCRCADLVKPPHTATNYIAQQPTPEQVAALDAVRAEALAAGATEVQDSLLMPPCETDPDEPIRPAGPVPNAPVVDLLAELTARLERIRNAGPDGQPTAAEVDAYRAGVNRAIALVAGTGLRASGLGGAR